MRVPLKTYVEIPAEAVGDLLRVVGDLLRTAGELPEAGGDSAMHVNGNYMAELSYIWKDLPEVVHETFGTDGRLK